MTEKTVFLGLDEMDLKGNFLIKSVIWTYQFLVNAIRLQIIVREFYY